MKYNANAIVEQVNLSIEGENLKEDTCFNYLGSNISANCTVGDEPNYRIGLANDAYGILWVRAFKNHNLRFKTKLLMFHAVVVSPLLYGSEA